MNSRERLIAAINHRQPDRVPIDLGGTQATGINVTAYARLRRALGLSERTPRVFDVFGMLAEVDTDLREAIGGDVVMVPPLAPRFDIPVARYKPWRLPGPFTFAQDKGLPVEVPEAFETAPDDDGGLLLMVGGHALGKMPKDGFYFSELANATMGGLDAMQEPPDPDTVRFPLLTDEDLRFRQDAARRLYRETDKALVVDLTDNCRWDTSIPNWLYAMAADPNRTSELHARKVEALIAKVQQLAEAVEPYVEVFAIYQDYGTQRGELVAPATFARLIAPHYRRLFDWIHQHTHWKVFFHSCGSIYRLIPHMITMGVDILNPLQTNAARMDPACLKAEFRDRLVFWGGGADTQTTLPFGAPDDVREQVAQRIQILGRDGAYVFAPTQDIQADVPPENLVAMYTAAREFGCYPAR